MATLQSFKIQGQTTADVAIATKTVTIDSDGFLRYSDSSSHPRSIRMTGDVGRFLKEILTGTNGLTAAVLPS